MSYVKELIVDMLAVYFIIVTTVITATGVVWAVNEIGFTDIQCTVNKVQP